jgi:hypothetical protein
MKRKKKKQDESGRDRDALSGVNARASARSLISGGQSGDGKNALQSSPGAMRVERKQIECKIMSLVEPNANKQQSNELRISSRTKELVALSIVSAKQDQSNQLMPELGKEQVENVDGEKLLEREVREQSHVQSCAQSIHWSRMWPYSNVRENESGTTVPNHPCTNGHNHVDRRC